MCGDGIPLSRAAYWPRALPRLSARGSKLPFRGCLPEMKAAMNRRTPDHRPRLRLAPRSYSIPGCKSTGKAQAFDPFLPAFRPGGVLDYVICNCLAIALKGQESTAGGKRGARSPRSAAGMEASPERAADISAADWNPPLQGLFAAHRLPGGRAAARLAPGCALRPLRGRVAL
jgi:hypothetical protein